MSEHKIFVSHVHADNSYCDQLVAALKQRGFAVWYDRDDLQSGRFLSQEMQRGLTECRYFVAVVSAAARTASFWVDLEFESFLNLMAHDASRMIIPIKLDVATMPPFMNAIKWLDGAAMSIAFIADQIAHTLSQGTATPPAARLPQRQGYSALFTTYLQQIEQQLKLGQATEESFRAALEHLIQGASTVITVNEPKRIACGAPDILVARSEQYGAQTIGYIETKDIGAALDVVEKSEQLTRYIAHIDNLILTDYLAFRWYEKGRRQRSATLATRDSKGKLHLDQGGAQAVGELLDAFLGRAPEPVRSPKDLAERMAKQTRMMRDIVVTTFAQKAASPAIQDLFAVFETVLIPGLTEREFADMFAQTLAYGLFAARYNHQGTQPFQRQHAATEIPRTNPFLRRLFTMIASNEMDDEPFIGFVDDLTQLLAQTDMSAVLAQFGKRTRREDPMVHFYETFLTAYDPALREVRGVYYTPDPVVQYIVQSVDHLLRADFKIAQGLADSSPSPRVLVLDPACGTGTFLYRVIDHIRETYRASGNAGMWSGYVAQHLLRRIFGFELLMAPHAMAHLKLSMQLAALDLPEAERATWAYNFGSDERLGVYLTNTLDDALKHAQITLGRFISEEANAAVTVKREQPIMVVLGNPPYSGHSANRGEWIKQLLHGIDLAQGQGGKTVSYFQVDGQPLDERNPKWLNDDYVKFIRFAI